MKGGRLAAREPPLPLSHSSSRRSSTARARPLTLVEVGVVAEGVNCPWQQHSPAEGVYPVRLHSRPVCPKGRQLLIIIDRLMWRTLPR